VNKLYRFPKPCMLFRNTHIMSALADALRDGNDEVVNKVMDRQFAAYVTAGTEARIFAHLQESGMLLVEVLGLTGKWIVHPSAIEPLEEGQGDEAILIKES
jgi:hypothetical protein